VGYIKQVVLGFHFAERDTMAAIRNPKESAIATGDQLSATPENPTTTFIQLRIRNSKVNPNMGFPLFMRLLQTNPR